MRSLTTIIIIAIILFILSMIINWLKIYLIFPENILLCDKLKNINNIAIAGDIFNTKKQIYYKYTDKHYNLILNNFLLKINSDNYEVYSFVIQ